MAERKNISQKIKTLENKANSGTPLTSAEQSELNSLRKKQQNLTDKINKMKKPLLDAKTNLKSAKNEQSIIQKAASQGNPDSVRKSALSRIKKGKNKVRINLKKLPPAYVNELKSGLGKMQAAAKAGSRVIRGISKVAKPVTAIVSAVDIYNAYQSGGIKKAARQTAKLGTAGAMAFAGAKGGAALGAAIGSVVPGIGTAVGGVVGSIVGGIAGWWAGEKTYDTVEKALLPTDTPEGYEAAQNGTLELELSEEELREFLTEYPMADDAIEWIE